MPEPDAFIDGRGIWLEDSWWKWESWKHHLDLFKVQRYNINVSPELVAELSTGQIQVRHKNRLE